MLPSMRQHRIHSPALGNRRALERFGEPRARAARRVGWQCVESKEPIVDDLMRVARAAVLAECAQYEQRHMITPRDTPVEENPVQHRRLERCDTAFLQQLA